jgi:hypothetical protein
MAHARLIGELEALVAEEPLRERSHGQLMLALYRSGRKAEALAAYQVARQVFHDELGLEPGQALQRLQQQILSADPSLELPAAASVSPPPARTVVISAIVGTAGVGKTALAIRWAHQVRDQFPDGQSCTSTCVASRPPRRCGRSRRWPCS